MRYLYANKHAWRPPRPPPEEVTEESSIRSVEPIIPECWQQRNEKCPNVCALEGWEPSPSFLLFLKAFSRSLWGKDSSPTGYTSQACSGCPFTFPTHSLVHAVTDRLTSYATWWQAIVMTGS